MMNNKRLIQNISLLFIVQGSNYLLPLIAFPYLVRILGVEQFGLLAFALATANYFKIIINYGFDLSATKDIAQNRNNKKELEKIFNSIITLKILLFFISIAIFTSIILNLSIFENNISLYYLTFLSIVGDILFPIWFFQGIEKMKFITYLTFISKSFFLIAIFLFVKNQKDLLLVPLFTALGGIIAGIIAIYIIKINFRLNFFLPNKKTLYYHLKEGWYMFQGLFNMTIINNSIIFILGIFTTHEVVGSYSIAEKLIRAIKNMTSPISQAVYPYLANMYKKNQKEAYLFSIKLTFLVSIVMLLVSTLLIFFGQDILTLLFGKEEVTDISVLVLKFLSFYPLVSSIIHIYCTQNMIFLDMKSLYAKVFLYASLFNITSAVLFIPIYGYIAGAIIVIGTEIIIGVMMSYYIHKRIYKNDK